MKSWMARIKEMLAKQEGYILPLVMLVLMAAGMMSAVLLVSITTNQQHVARDKALTQSLAVAEAGLNQYLWMVSSGVSSKHNDFAIPGNPGPDVHKQIIQLADPDSNVKGTYTIQVIPPSGQDSRLMVKVTGQAESPTEAPRTIMAHIGRPSFSEYILLVDDSVYIGGPLDRVWHGKTHSNTGIRIETRNITDPISCAQQRYSYEGSTKDGIWSSTVPSKDASRTLWKYPVPKIDFNTVTADFNDLNDEATGEHNLPYVQPSQSGAAHGWYIKLLPGAKYQVAKVTEEHESRPTPKNDNRGGYLTYGALSAVRNYPTNGVIYVNDNVWVEGTNLDGRITIASSGQLPEGRGQATSINVVGDLTYSAKDGSVAVGLIAQNNVKIPMYAPVGKSGNLSSMDMEIDAAIIAQEGAEYVSRDSSGSSRDWGPRRNKLTFYGSISSHDTPTRATESGSDYCGFKYGENVYDGFLLYNPPPYFPTVGSYQIMDWRELPSSEAVTMTP